MSDATDRTFARARLLQLCEPAVTPALTTTPEGTSEVDVILDKHRRATTWAAGTYYAVGSVVLPPIRNGRRYRAIQPGVSSSAAGATVETISVTNPGSGYTSAPTVTLSGGGGSGAAAVAVVSGGYVTGVFVTDKGSGYTSAPTVAFSGGAGSSAAASASLVAPPDFPARNEATVSEGASDPALTWQEDGPDYENVYDVRAAVHEAFMQKAAKAAENFNLKIGSLSFDLEQGYQHCLQMARLYAPLNFG